MSVDEKIALARRFVAEVAELAAKCGLNFFVVTDGASGIRNSGNPAVEHARKAHMEWGCRRDCDARFRGCARAQGAYGMEAQTASIRRTTGRRIRTNSNHQYQNGNRL